MKKIWPFVPASSLLNYGFNRWAEARGSTPPKGIFNIPLSNSQWQLQQRGITLLTSIEDPKITSFE